MHIRTAKAEQLMDERKRATVPRKEDYRTRTPKRNLALGIETLPLPGRIRHLCVCDNCNRTQMFAVVAEPEELDRNLVSNILRAGWACSAGIDLNPQFVVDPENLWHCPSCAYRAFEADEAAYDAQWD